MSDRPSRLLVGFCLLAACAGPPASLPAVEASLRRTLDDVLDAELRRVVDESWQAARRAEARSASTVWGDHGRAEELWAAALTQARSAWLEQRRRDQLLEGRWLAAGDEARGLRRQALALGHGQVPASSLAALRKADMAWQRAERLAQAGDLEGAVQAAAESTRAAAEVLTAREASEARFHQPDLRRLWASWARMAIEDSRRDGAALVVDKLNHRLHLWRKGRLVGTFTAELGRLGLERKLRAGDRATPEGRYRVKSVREGSSTQYFKALLLDYPTTADRQRLDTAIREGLAPRGSKPGSLIEIHGHGGRGQDWTDGCVALRDSDMDAIWPVARVGLSVTIVGVLP